MSKNANTEWKKLNKKIVNAFKRELPLGRLRKSAFCYYDSLEKYTDCEHSRSNTISPTCPACDTAWLIARCKSLEDTIRCGKTQTPKGDKV